MTTFDANNIQLIFGNEAAESESIERLKSYYVKGATFDEAITNHPLRLIVGHKGIGKSALIKVAMDEDRQSGRLPILIRPDDIVELATGANSFLELIRDWKIGIGEIIANKVFQAFGLDPAEKVGPIPGKALTGFLGWLVNSVTVV